MAQGAPPDVYFACLDSEGATALVSQLYGRSVCCAKRLPGYEDVNFYIETLGTSSPEGTSDQQYVLKAINSRDSECADVLEARTDVLLHLTKCGIQCPTPIKNLEGEYGSLEEVVDKSGKQPAGVKFLVVMFKYIPGKIVRDLCQPGDPVPDRWFYDYGRSLGAISKALLDFQAPSAIEALKKQAPRSVWSPNAIPQIRNILFQVKDAVKRQLAESILDEFEAQVVPKMSELRQCAIHTDFNDMNIIHLDDKLIPNVADWHTAGGLPIPADQDAKLGALGVIDFTDMVFSNLLFDAGNSQAYMMLSQPWGDPLVSGGHFLAGYNSVLPLTVAELGLMRCCMASRLVQSLVMGLHTYAMDPSNEYVLDTQKTGWSVLSQLWSKPNAELISMWDKIAELYSK